MTDLKSWLPPPPPRSTSAQKGNRAKWIAGVAISGTLAGIIIWTLGKNTYRDYKLASAATERFHHQLNTADYDAIYSEASDEFRRAGAREASIRFFGTVHEKMGNSGETSVAGFHVNWRNGRASIDQVLNTKFALGEGQESFVWIREGDRLRLYGYHIDSSNLR